VNSCAVPSQGRVPPCGRLRGLPRRELMRRALWCAAGHPTASPRASSEVNSCAVPFCARASHLLASGAASLHPWKQNRVCSFQLPFPSLGRTPPDLLLRAAGPGRRMSTLLAVSYRFSSSVEAELRLLVRAPAISPWRYLKP
jgi:hypothetical protein